MSVLDTILVDEMLDSPTTVNADYFSSSVDIMNRENEFSVQIDYNNGNTVDMLIKLEVSNDNISYVPMGQQQITDVSGTHIFDIQGTGTNYIRISIIVTTGSIDVQRIFYSGKRRH